MMQDSIDIRPARPIDSESAAVLLRSAYTHTQIPYPPLEDPESGWANRLTRYFRQEGNRFSFQNIHVAERDAEIVGLVLGFGGQDESRLNAAVGPWLEQEAHDDEWYVDALAVFKNWTRHGIGTRLMQTAEQQARQHGYAKIALHVATENQAALNLYTHLGYMATERDILYDRPHVRMVKMLDSTELGDVSIKM
jgi:ribosomal protein S18 acetylase RimI-like enzyme